MKYLNEVLEFFDISDNYRSYQIELFGNYVGKEILEVGAGRGKIIEILAQNSEKQFTLLELDKNFFDFLNNKFKSKNIKVLEERTQNIKENKFDTIFYLDVIEHIEDDKFELDTAYDLLKKNGHLIIIVPAFQILFSKFDQKVGHFRRYRKEFFKRYSEEKNLKIKKLVYFDFLGFFIILFSKLLNLTNSKKTTLGIKIWNFLIPLSRLIDKITFHSIGKSIVCIYEKKG
tara:strand:- start:175 stop:864 length:690 start_codon:yes stop_codon:yes gene_type:complete